MGPKPTNPFFLSDKGKAGGKGDPPSFADDLIAANLVSRLATLADGPPGLSGPYGNLSLLGQTLKLF